MTGQERNDRLFIADIIRQAFGLNSPIYIPWGDNVPFVAGEYPNVQFLPGETDETEQMSEFGLPVLGSVMFEDGEYHTYDRISGALRKTRYAAYTLPYSCVVEFDRAKHITKTDTLGATGTVKELYGLKDWSITIRGIAIKNRNGSGLSAQQQIDELVRWSEVCDSIGVQGSLFRRKGIYNIVIENVSIRPVVARWDAIPFQIEASSDEPIEFYSL